MTITTASKTFCPIRVPKQYKLVIVCVKNNVSFYCASSLKNALRRPVSELELTCKVILLSASTSWDILILYFIRTEIMSCNYSNKQLKKKTQNKPQTQTKKVNDRVNIVSDLQFLLEYFLSKIIFCERLMNCTKTPNQILGLL